VENEFGCKQGLDFCPRKMHSFAAFVSLARRRPFEASGTCHPHWRRNSFSGRGSSRFGKTFSIQIGAHRQAMRRGRAGSAGKPF